MRQRKTKSLHDEDETLLPNAQTGSNIWLKRLESLLWIGVAYAIAYFTNLLTNVRDLAYGYITFLILDGPSFWRYGAVLVLFRCFCLSCISNRYLQEERWIYLNGK